MRTNKKQIIFIVIIIIVAIIVAYFCLTRYYFSREKQYPYYTASDFPNALETMSEDILEKSLIDLNKQYEKLNDVNDQYTYIRWLNIGILKKRLHDYQGAIEAWEKAIEYNPDQSLTYGNLADLYLFTLGEYEKAEEYYQKVLSMKTDNYNYYFGLAALYRYNMTEKAYLIEGLMLDGAEKNPHEAQNYYLYLADYFYRDKKDTVTSKYYANKVLEIEPELENQLPDYDAK